MEIFNVTPSGLAARLWEGIDEICKKARQRGFHIEPGEFVTRSQVAPSCSLGSTTVEIAQRVAETLVQVGEILRG